MLILNQNNYPGEQYLNLHQSKYFLNRQMNFDFETYPKIFVFFKISNLAFRTLKHKNFYFYSYILKLFLYTIQSQVQFLKLFYL